LELFFAYVTAPLGKNMASQIVLISGCSSGIGLATAVLLAKDAEKRFKVYATMRNLAKKEQLEEEGKEYLGKTLIIKQMNQLTKLYKKCWTLKGKSTCCVSNNEIFLKLSTHVSSLKFVSPSDGHDHPGYQRFSRGTFHRKSGRPKACNMRGMRPREGL